MPCQDAKGEPAPDTNDGVMYVITEVAQYSLKDSEVEKTHDGWMAWNGREFGFQYHSAIRQKMNVLK